MVPMVSTAEKAAACVRAIRYPLLGDCGLAGMVRASMTTAYIAKCPSLFSTRRSRPSKEWKTRGPLPPWMGWMLFIGPMDLKLQVQSYPERTRLDFTACLREVASAAWEAGKACGLLCRQTDDFSEPQALGFTHLAIETDITLLRESYSKVIQPLRGKKA